MHFRLVVFACVVDGVAAVLLILTGVALTAVTADGMSSAADSSEFAFGMLLGGVAWGAWLLAALLLAHAYWCWRRLRRFGPGHGATAPQIALLLFVPVAAAAIAVAVGLRLIA